MVLDIGSEGAARPLSLDLSQRTPPLARVRRWVDEVLAGLDEEKLGDTVLVVTELVSNAFDHGRAPRALRLHRHGTPWLVRVEVDDASPSLPVIGRSRLGGYRGRGMVIVSNLCRGWGVTHRSGGKTVWAEIACAS
ncbi:MULTISPECIES: ATP-binding protein [Actinosynnema]|uniref:ATP-binding protein n=1 Tax=Actinosynnema TaxID=40566 RepID=UPI0020A31F8B|nr:ATP-binding protein [Actinosynnema pretiosum]